MKYLFCRRNSKKQSYLGKLVMFILVMLVSTISFGVKLGTIKGLSKLSNYNELKDVDVSDITTLKIINGIRDSQEKDLVEWQFSIWMGKLLDYPL